MHLKTTAREALRLARVAEAALVGTGGKRLAQAIRVTNLVAFAQFADPEAEVWIDVEDYIALTRLPEQT